MLFRSVLARRQWKLANKWRADRRLVDIGCGTGQFLKVASQAVPLGFAYGVEIDATSLIVACSAGLAVSEEIPLSDQPTLFTMWHSAEHFPVTELISLFRSVNNHSEHRLLISIPNSDSTALARYGTKAAFSDPEHHHTQMNRVSLEFLLRSSGWKIVAQDRLWLYGLFSCLQTTLNLTMPKNFVYETMRRKGERLPLLLLPKVTLALLRKMPALLRLLAAELNSKSRSCLIIIATPSES